ncbi:MAG: TRAP transporter large permease [Planctomycetota bacterium]|jgi:tripartite ATP-independent transporter DctM subunit|nr:TRAP transporter large permease [Planctomycetota bacterium]
MPLLILILFIAIMLIGTPVCFAIGSLTAISFMLLRGDYSIIPQKMFAGIDAYTFMCILLFILAADIMSVGGITGSIVRFCESLVGHIRGGLAHVNVLGSMLFAGISGSAIADASGLGPIEIEMMSRGGYPKNFSCAVTAASAIIGPIIPPSNIMIIYATVVGTVSIGKMFLGGILPGILLGAMYMIYCYIVSIKRNYPYNPKAPTINHILKCTWETMPALILPLIIICTISFGVCTATESSAIAVIYSIVVAVAKRNLSLQSFARCCIRSAKATANVLFIIAISTAMGWAITTLQITPRMVAFCLEYIHSPVTFLMFMNVLLLIVGMLLDAAPALLLLVPILLPIARQYGIDEIHFGIVVCVNLMIGNITPPVGMILFVISNVGKIALSALYRAIVPFALVAVATLFIITYIPQSKRSPLNYS